MSLQTDFNPTFFKRLFGINKKHFFIILKEHLNETKKVNEQEVDELAEKLRIGKRKKLKIVSKIVKKMIQDFLKENLSEMRLSEKKETELRVLLSDLKTHMSQKTEEKILLARTLWEWDENGIPEIDTDVNLGKEKCFYIAKNVSYLETRKERGQESLKKLGKGDLYITNKKVILMKDYKTKSFKWEDILYVNFYRDGFSLARNKGKNPHFKFYIGTKSEKTKFYYIMNNAVNQ